MDSNNIKPENREELFFNALINNTELPEPKTREERLFRQLIQSQPIKNIDLNDNYSIRPWLIEEDGCYNFKTNHFAMDIKSISGQEFNPEEKIAFIFARTNFLFLKIYHFENSTTKFIDVSVNDRTANYQITYKLENGIWTTEKWNIGYNSIYNNFLSKTNIAKYSLSYF